MEKKINKLLIVSLILAALFGGAALLLRDLPHESGAEENVSFPIQEYLSIDVQRLDVSLIPYDETEIRVEYKNDRPLEFEIGDNELMITENVKFVVSLFAGDRSDFGVKIYLPKTAYRDISIYTGTGSVSVGNISCKKLSAVTETGDITIESMRYLSSVTTTSGKISANIDKIVQDTSFLNRDGDIDLVLPPESSVAVDFKTTDGECKTDLISGHIPGSYLYAFNGGKRRIDVTAEHGTFTFKERN